MTVIELLKLAKQKGVCLFLRGDADNPLIFAFFDGFDHVFKPEKTLKATLKKLETWLQKRPDVDQENNLGGQNGTKTVSRRYTRGIT